MRLGDAIYRVPGLTFEGHLDDFWTNPEPPEPGLYGLFGECWSIAAWSEADWRASRRSGTWSRAWPRTLSADPASELAPSRHQSS